MTTTPAATIEQRLAAWRERGETEALGELLRWQRDRACALAVGILGVQSDAEDAVQQAFVKLLSRRKGFEDRTAFTAAVTRAVVQCAIDLLRARRSRGQHQEAYAAMHRDQHHPGDALAEREQAEQVRAALADLPDDERVAVVLCCQDGHSIAAGARLLELPRETLRHRVKRGLGRLRAGLAARGLSLGSAAIAASLAASAPAASPALCAGLDAALPGAACATVPAAPAATGLGAGVAASAAGLSLAAVGGAALALACGGALAFGPWTGAGSGSATATDTATAAGTAAVDHPATDRSDDMDTRNALVAAALAAAAATPLSAGDEVPVAELPAAVVAAATAAEGAVIVEAERDTDDGRVVYEVEIRVGTAEHELTIAEDGTVLEREEEIALADVPEAITAKALAAAPGATLLEAERKTEGDEVEWEFEARDAEGQRIEIEIDAEGGVEVELDRRKGRDHRGGGEAAPDDAAADADDF